ncbi:hypothetical protein ACJX0J_027600, partial [Zea mays]
RMAENESKPEGIPPSQGVKYVGFGSSPAPSANKNGGAAQGDVLQVVSQENRTITMEYMFDYNVKTEDFTTCKCCFITCINQLVYLGLLTIRNLLV